MAEAAAKPFFRGKNRDALPSSVAIFFEYGASLVAPSGKKKHFKGHQRGQHPRVLSHGKKQ